VFVIRQCGGAARGLVLAAVVLLPVPVLANEPCQFVTIGSGKVSTALGDVIALDDGRKLRLAGLEASDLAQGTLAPGTVVTLKRLANARETDRYGRLVAHVFIAENGTERWFQAELVRKGLARAAPRVGNADCARKLLAEEQSARAAKLGLWGEAYYVMSKAEDPAEVLKNRGRLALVEGRVLSVRESGGTIYVNFGRRWSEDFTVTIAKRNERTFSAAGLEPKSLSGQRVRVRGWIEERGGPWVDAARPEQIEVLGR
jgi:endonuclease YncB( thermonuclease family)